MEKGDITDIDKELQLMKDQCKRSGQITVTQNSTRVLYEAKNSSDCLRCSTSLHTSKGLDLNSKQQLIKSVESPRVSSRPARLNKTIDPLFNENKKTPQSTTSNYLKRHKEINFVNYMRERFRKSLMQYNLK